MAIRFEEAGLVKLHGENYERRGVPMLIPSAGGREPEARPAVLSN